MLVPPASYVYIHIVSYPAAFLHMENPMNPNVCWQIFWNFPASNLWISRWPPRDRPMTHGEPWLRRPTSCWIPPPMMASIWSPSTFMQRIHRRIHFSLLNWPGFGFVDEIYFWKNPTNMDDSPLDVLWRCPMPCFCHGFWYQSHLSHENYPYPSHDTGLSVDMPTMG